MQPVVVGNIQVIVTIQKSHKQPQHAPVASLGTCLFQGIHLKAFVVKTTALGINGSMPKTYEEDETR